MTAPRIRSDDSIGRPEDIGRLVAKPAPYLCARCETGDHCRGDETCLCKCRKDARVTLNLPPALLRDVEHWAADAAETLNLPRVRVQSAIRAMLRACVTDAEAMSAALTEIRKGPA